MSDDLVARLRDIAWVSPDASDATIADKVVHEAADEIERLQAVILELQDTIDGDGFVIDNQKVIIDRNGWKTDE